ncbi:ODORANT1 protein [Spatholobus suberectus]|nr:ODORANT1 protein [Spatholobus suberectus]
MMLREEKEEMKYGDREGRRGEREIFKPAEDQGGSAVWIATEDGGIALYQFARIVSASGGAGHIEKLAGLNSYVTGSPISNLARLLVSDIYGLLRCGKSWRFMCINYPRPDLKRGLLSKYKEKMVIDLHAQLGNRDAQDDLLAS